jgi:DNA-binding GntR family transcriptional regulator
MVVSQALMRDIERGKYKVGTMLPTEHEICERFNISRHTAREAIRRLTDIGLVTRRAGIGTTIQAQSIHSRYIASISDPSELFAFTRRTKLEILSERRILIDGPWAEILPAAQGQRWLCVSALRWMEGANEPVSHTYFLVHPDYESVRARMSEPGVTVYRLIEELHGERVAELKQEIGAIRLPRDIARHLKAKAGSPALRIHRYYFGSHDTPFSVSVSTYPEGRFNLTTRWRLDWTADGA